MRSSKWQVMGRSMVVAVAAFLAAACAEVSPVGPNAGSGIRLSATSAGGIPSAAARAVDLGSCSNLAAPTESRLALHTYASGVQIYRWNGTSWTFVAPSALLHADAAGTSVVGDHYAGPTWESNSGSKAVGAVFDRCTPDAHAIPWLLLTAVSAGPGVFEGTTHIQRLNTVGGLAPAAPGTVVGEEARIAYTAEYYFYRAR